MTSVRAYKANDPTQPKFAAGYQVTAVQELSCTDLAGNNNKYYHLEVQCAPDGRARVHSEYGRVGAPSPAREYRYFDDRRAATDAFAAIIKEKTTRKHDTYVKIDLAARAVGSSDAKAIVKPLASADPTPTPAPTARTSRLEPEVRSLVAQFFGATTNFVATHLKCPLGQLSREQINHGRAVLDEAKGLVNAAAPARPSELAERRAKFDELTNRFYSLIPHNFGYRKLDPEGLRLSDLQRITHKEADLDVFLDAKNLGEAMHESAHVDEQYASLAADLAFVAPSDPVFAWVSALLVRTRAANHPNFSRLAVKRLFRVSRTNEGNFERPTPFLATARRVAAECGRYDAPHVKKVADRPDLTRDLAKLYARANVWPVWHGTRNANMTGIITRGLLIRPAGAVHAGSMFGDGIYFAHQSTKAINYSSVRGSHWASGRDDIGYVFLADVAFGNLHVANQSQFYPGPPKGFHSVYGKAGTTAGLVNDEMIVYRPTGTDQQHALRYIVEVTN